MKKHQSSMGNVPLIVLGSLFVAVANAGFIVPFDIVMGGMTSVAMMVSKLLLPMLHHQTTDIVLWVLNISLLFVAFFAIGKQFTMSTIVGTVTYSAFMSLFLRLDIVGRWGLLDYFSNGDTTAKLILFGLAGGVIGGFGLSLCFLGKGSTGGSDIISVSMVKYLDIKQDTASLMIDVFTIILGFILFKDWGKLLVGILGALASSTAVKSFYGKFNSHYILDIMTDKVDDLKKIIEEELNETCTIYSVKGGRSGQDKTIVHCILVYREAKKLKGLMPSIDEKAFITEMETTTTIGGSTNDAYIREEEKRRLITRISAKAERK